MLRHGWNCHDAGIAEYFGDRSCFNRNVAFQPRVDFLQNKFGRQALTHWAASRADRAAAAAFNSREFVETEMTSGFAASASSSASAWRAAQTFSPAQANGEAVSRAPVRSSAMMAIRSMSYDTTNAIFVKLYRDYSAFECRRLRTTRQLVLLFNSLMNYDSSAKFLDKYTSLPELRAGFGKRWMEARREIRVKDKKTVIFGASSGIGAAVARRFATCERTC